MMSSSRGARLDAYKFPIHSAPFQPKVRGRWELRGAGAFGEARKTAAVVGGFGVRGAAKWYGVVKLGLIAA